MEQEVKLTKLAKCAGCGAKVGAGVLAKLLEGIKVLGRPWKGFPGPKVSFAELKKALIVLRN